MRANRQYGFTLLEALITVVIVSLGLLGLLGLQTISIANTQVSHARSIATVAADNMAERMRANPAGLNNNAYDGIDNPSSGTQPKDCATNQCDADEMAAHDAYQWDAYLEQVLSAGQGRIDCVDADTGDADACSPNSPHVISIIWQETDRTADRVNPGNDKCNADNEAGNVLEGANITDRCFQTTFLP